MSRIRLRHESLRQALSILGPADRSPKQRFRDEKSLRRCVYEALEQHRLKSFEARVFLIILEAGDYLTGALFWSNRTWCKKLGLRLRADRSLPTHVVRALRSLESKGLLTPLRFVGIPSSREVTLSEAQKRTKECLFVRSELARFGGRIVVRSVWNRDSFWNALDANRKAISPPLGEGAPPPLGEGAPPPLGEGAFLLKPLTSVEVSDPISPLPPRAARASGIAAELRARSRAPEELTRQASSSRSAVADAPPRAPAAALPTNAGASRSRERSAPEREADERAGASGAGASRPRARASRSPAETAVRWHGYRAAWAGRPGPRDLADAELAPVVRILDDWTEEQLFWVAWAEGQTHTDSPRGATPASASALCRPGRLQKALALARSRGLDTFSMPPAPPPLAPVAKDAPAPFDRGVREQMTLNVKEGLALQAMLEGRSGSETTSGVTRKRTP